ncbi:MAG: HEAT repeat domain-containing protein [Planctomycetaceae bacterium]
MTLGHTSARLILAGAILVAAGCASQPPRSRMADTGNDVLPSHNRAQLLAAARQYEKEGRPDLAVKYYRQVLALEPENNEAHDGLHYVQSGQPRTDANYQEIIASAKPKARPRLRTAEEFTKSHSVIDERTAQLIANAAARATAEAISNAAANATAEYAAAAKAPAPTPKPEQTPTPTVVTASTEPVISTEPAIRTPDPRVEKSIPPVTHATAENFVRPVPEIVARDVVKLEVVAVVAEEKAKAASSTTAVPAGAPTIEPSPLVPRDWTEHSPWQSTSLTRLCQDANAAVLREVAKLDSQDPAMRQDGLRCLAQLGPDASSATLAVRMLLHDNVELVRAHAAWTLWELTGDASSSVQPLTEMLASPQSDVVQFAAYTLSGIGARATPALPVLRQLEVSDDQLIQLHAAEALARIAPEADRAAAVETLIMLTAQPSGEIRALALLALGEVVQQPTPSITTALMSALHDSDPAVRAAAALSLGGFGAAASSAIVQLEFVAESDQKEVQQAAAAALECIRRAN